MAKMGVIERVSDSKGWNSPIICVGKKDPNEVRVCVNLKNTVNRRLLEPEAYTVPSVDECLR